MEWRKSVAGLPVKFKLTTLASVTAVAVVGAYAFAHKDNFPIIGAHAAPAAAATTAAAAVASNSSPASGVPFGLPNFADIAAQQGKAVVNISVTGAVKTVSSRAPKLPKFDAEDPFADLFKRFQIPMPRGGMPTRGQGSGFIVSPDGMILTNAHVVADADEVTVKLMDRREFKAKVIGVDKPTDVAVLRINADNLPVVRVGNPASTRVGEWVVAIGSPFGFENSVTAGIVSAKSRSLPSEGYVPFLQTDVAINPGNSGGPLFNLNGEVIGINSQIYSQSGGYQGLSFAIPIDVAMKVERQLVDKGRVSRGRLGVVIQELDQPLADSFGLDKVGGALVGSVERGSPAEKAGVEAGDVILKFNGKDVTRSADLPPLVADVAPGSSAEVQIWREKKARDLRVTVGEMKPAKGESPSREVAKGELGLSIRPLSPEERKDADVSAGLLIEEVSDGPAARAGLREGDVILSVNGKKVASADDLRKQLDKKDKRVALQVLRDDQTLFIPIKLG